jgi:DNA-binding MarR family transcriptional regulator
MKTAAARTRAASPVDDYRLEEQVGHVMRRAHQRHAAIFQDGMGDLQLTPTQFAALVKIRDTGQVSQNQLGRLTAMDPATIQGVIQRLEERKLIERHSDPGDRRRTILCLSAAGAEIAVDAIQRARKITEATLAPLDDAERRAFLALLQKLI